MKPKHVITIALVLGLVAGIVIIVFVPLAVHHLKVIRRFWL